MNSSLNCEIINVKHVNQLGGSSKGTFGYTKSNIGQLDKVLQNIPLAVSFERKVGVPKAYAAALFAFMCSFMVFFNYAGQLVANLIGFLYPAYASAKALESPQKDDDTQWLTYWVCYGFLSVMYGITN